MFFSGIPYHSVEQAWVDKALVQDVAKLDEDSCHAVIVGNIDKGTMDPRVELILPK